MSRPAPAALCLGWHPKPTRAADGLRLCEGHLSRLTRDIAECPALHDELAAHLVRTGSGGEVVNVSREPGIDLDGAVVRARDHIAHDLHGWVRVALEEGPWDHGPCDSISALACWLLPRVHWLASRLYADEVATDFATSAREARAAIQPDRARRFEIGACIERRMDDEADLGPCEGVLFATIRASESMLPSAIVCDVDPEHVWTADEWHLIGRSIAARARAASGTGYVDLARRVALDGCLTAPLICAEA